MLENLYENHIKGKINLCRTLSSKLNYSGIIFFSGSIKYFYQDDQEQVFRPNPQAMAILPHIGANEYIIINEQDVEIWRIPKSSFWVDTSEISGKFSEKYFKIKEFENEDKLIQKIKDILSKHAFIGPKPKNLKDTIPIYNPSRIISALNWDRAKKTEFEIKCLKESAKISAKGHLAVLEKFKQGCYSELELHLKYLEAVKCKESELPYESIIAINHKSAILHYQNKRNFVSNPHTLLIDAGANYLGYATDITRTYAIKKNTHPSFLQLLSGVEEIQKKLTKSIKAGVSYEDIHKTSHVECAELLLKSNILQGISSEAALAEKITQTFYPHGLGHLLGLQVHDVAGHQVDPEGTPCPSSEEFPKLRMNRELREGEVITIEPGLYFIPMLLDQHRNTKTKKHFNWPLIDELIPAGGIRIEDDVLVKKNGNVNLSREYLNPEIII